MIVVPGIFVVLYFQQILQLKLKEEDVSPVETASFNEALATLCSHQGTECIFL
jgi:hypothetical protein